jgi:malonyl CoA-acyl carrier protein transacylase
MREFPGVIELISEAENTLERPLLSLLVNERRPDSTSRENQVQLYLGSCALWMVAENEGLIPEEARRIFFGASAGEYAAFMAAGIFDFNDGLKLIDVRGEEMHRASIINPGEMLIASGLPFSEAEKIVAAIEGAYAVNDNPALQTVFSGTAAALAETAHQIKNSDKWRHVKLDKAAIAEAAHSPHMAPAVAGLKKALKRAKVKKPNHIVLGNRAREITSPRDTRRHLPQQLTRGVKLAQSAKVLRDDYQVDTFVDVGPGKILYSQMKRQFRKSVDVVSFVDALLPEK